MTTTALVPVFAGTLAGQPTQLCNARDLHATLGVGKDFSTWIKDRIEQYGFSAGDDYPPVSGKIPGKRGQPRTDYHLTLDMAKELAMVENNERGRQVRRYFIQIEKDARAKVGAGVGAGTSALTAPAFDLRATMLAGNSTPTVPLPADVQAAVNRKAWAMAHDAYELCREHLARRVAYVSEFGYPERMLDKRAALAAIAETTLDMALVPEHFNALCVVQRMTEQAASMANEFRDKLAAEVEKLTVKGAMQ